MLRVDASYRLIRSRRCTSEKDRAGESSTCLKAAKPRVLSLNLNRLGPLAVDVALDDWIPSLRQVIDHVVARLRVLQRQTSRHDEGIVISKTPTVLASGGVGGNGNEESKKDWQERTVPMRLRSEVQKVLWPIRPRRFRCDTGQITHAEYLWGGSSSSPDGSGSA
jgi:hypothetical protein